LQSFHSENSNASRHKGNRIIEGQDSLSYHRTVSVLDEAEPIGVSGWANYSPEYKKGVHAYQLPFGIIKSAQFTNLYTAGRSVSADDRAIDSLRLIPNCLITGQAAGIAAVKHDYPSIRTELEKQGCILTR
jgi:hypothetical protein